MNLPTIEDVNDVACDACHYPTCPAPRKECESVTASMASVGFFNDEDEEWTLYKTYGWASTLSGSGTSLSSNPAYNEGSDFVSQSRSASANSFVGNTADPNYSGGVAGGAGDCPYQEETITPVCSAMGTASQSNYAVKFWGGPPANADYGETDSITHSISSAEGEETEAHLAWEAIYTDAETWQGLHDTWETDHAAWQADYDAYQAAYDAWLIAYDAWVTGGEIGDPPAEPDPFEDPEPEEPTAEPAETYPACWYKITQTFVIYPHWFGKFSDGTPADPDDPEAFADWVEGGMIGDPPSSGTAVTYSYTDDPLSILNSLLVSGDGGITDEETYSDPVDYSTWVSATKAAAEAMLEFENEACLEDECSSDYSVTADPETTGAELSLTITKARYRFGIPTGDTWAGWQDAHDEWAAADPETRGPEPILRKTFELQWDEGFFPAAWTAWHALKTAYDAAVAAHAAWEACELETPGECGTEPDIPSDPGSAPSPAPTRIAKSWTWDGTLGGEWSDWFEVSIPEIDGETRVVNLMVICWRCSRTGQKPSAHGETFVFDE